MPRFAEYVINMEQLSLEAPKVLFDVVLVTGMRKNTQVCWESEQVTRSNCRSGLPRGCSN